ncbi:hypothetical protein PY092_17270 [Muricauda sp. 334s03]|uniref:Uncharacterized protein n=1 Tax=Flagellimonas yonaguniensis TaxID=3031325 RepID=A0ABT5Y388_9FLAO|nr:hypothetical protein [[Muricauda] yonaguniensis]MDF0717918.1 hypothetical protein [[Muricauda] yonaguniensis]
MLAIAIILVIMFCSYLVLEDTGLAIQKGRTLKKMDVSEGAVS